jgi:hypothetical protein
MMAEYLLATVERLTKEFCLAERPWEKFHPRSSTAVSFRQGCAARLIEKLDLERHRVLREEQRKEREAQATASHPSAAPAPSNGLVVANLIKSEKAANYDFMHGEGAHALMEARQRRWELEWEQSQARELAEHERRYADDPKYRKEFDREQAKAERRWEREANRAEPRYKGDHGAFSAGYRKGDDVSLDRQLDRNQAKALR